MAALRELAWSQVRDFGFGMLAAIGMFVGLCALQIALASRGKHRDEPRAKPPREFSVDMIYWPSTVVFRYAAKLIVVGALALGGYVLGIELSPNLYAGFGPVMQQPRWLMLIELFLLVDLMSYLSHRASHRVAWLWRFHAVHHSPRKVHWTSTPRLHPVNDLVTYAALVVPPLALGFPVDALAPLAPAIVLFATWSHSKAIVRLGLLQNVITGPLFHRWHHTHSHEGGNANFAGILSFWDRLLGTYYMPHGVLPERFGLDDGDLEESFWAQMVEPFRRRDRKANVLELPLSLADEAHRHHWG
jgi:sterol desaturase/sphingolipid hydroxylase (fatty acid hydroxylase superfamily)